MAFARLLDEAKAETKAEAPSPIKLKEKRDTLARFASRLRTNDSMVADLLDAEVRMRTVDGQELVGRRDCMRALDRRPSLPRARRSRLVARVRARDDRRAAAGALREPAAPADVGRGPRLRRRRPNVDADGPRARRHGGHADVPPRRRRPVHLRHLRAPAARGNLGSFRRPVTARRGRRP